MMMNNSSLPDLAPLLHMLVLALLRRAPSLRWVFLRCAFRFLYIDIDLTVSGLQDFHVLISAKKQFWILIW